MSLPAVVLHEEYVLLVDDSRTALAMMQQTLNNLGMTHGSLNHLRYRHWPGLKNGINRENRPLILLFPILKCREWMGFTFTRNLRGMPSYENAKIILHSSMSNPTNRLKAEEAGADDFVAKFAPNELAEHIFQRVRAGTVRRRLLYTPGGT